MDRSSCRDAAPLEVFAVVVGHAEQFADHQRRNRQREVLHQIHWRACTFHRVQLCVDDLDDARLETLHPPDGELGCQHAAQPRMFGRVEAEQVTRPRGGLFLFGRLRHALHREARRALVGEPLVVGQHGLDVLVPGDQVHLHAEGVGEFAHALGLADLPKLRGGAERITAHVQRR